MKVLIGTNNKGKVEGAKQAFEKFYENVEVVGISVDSGVSDEPVNDEIYQGASNRVNNLIKYAEDNKVEADFFRCGYKIWFNKRSIYNGTNWIYKWRHLERLEILYSACPRLLLNSVQSGNGGKNVT